MKKKNKKRSSVFFSVFTYYTRSDYSVTLSFAHFHSFSHHVSLSLFLFVCVCVTHSLSISHSHAGIAEYVTVRWLWVQSRWRRTKIFKKKKKLAVKGQHEIAASIHNFQTRDWNLTEKNRFWNQNPLNIENQNFTKTLI